LSGGDRFGRLLTETTLSNVESHCRSPEEIAELYPRLLSERRFVEWAGLFAEGAIIARVEAGVPTRAQTVAAALPEQIEYGEENCHFVESWDDVSVVRTGNLAVVTARYVLDVDRETRRGVDILTLVGDGRGWRIASLAYEQHELIAK
jgi:hypothetical protein